MQAVQSFLARHPVAALVTLHTGEQSVLWPWCYTPALTTDNDFMQATAEKMAAAWTATTGRSMYTLQSYNDYPTSSELIDWAWGRLHIHSYTQEVYAGSGMLQLVSAAHAAGPVGLHGHLAGPAADLVQEHGSAQLVGSPGCPTRTSCVREPRTASS